MFSWILVKDSYHIMGNWCEKHIHDFHILLAIHIFSSRTFHYAWTELKLLWHLQIFSHLLASHSQLMNVFFHNNFPIIRYVTSFIALNSSCSYICSLISNHAIPTRSNILSRNFVVSTNSIVVENLCSYIVPIFKQMTADVVYIQCNTKICIKYIAGKIVFREA